MLAVSRPKSPSSDTATHDGIVERQLVECRHEFLRFFRGRLARPQDAEDALQDFSLKALRAAHTLHDGEKVDAWLGRILRNTLTDHYRRHATRRRAEDAFGQEAETTVVAQREDQVEKPCRCMHALLPALKPEYAEIIRRADLEEAPRDRIAAELDLTANNVGVRLHRARRALKTKLEQKCAGCSDGGFQTCGCDPLKSSVMEE